MAPVRVSVPAPVLSSLPPMPEITPLTSVERSFEPTINRLEPRIKSPAPAIDPAVVDVSTPEISTVPPAWLMMAALPPELTSRNRRVPLFVMVALAAVLVSRKVRVPLLVIVALPALLLSLKFRLPLFVKVALPAVLVSKKFRKALLVIVALPAVLVL